jgi:opacity protein-like surface antigen
MKEICLLSLCILASASAALAQASSDYHKVEVYGGFSLGRIESNINSLSFTAGGMTQTYSNLCSAATGDQLGPNSQKFFCQRRSFNGFDGSVTYNVSRYIGIKGDFTGHFKTDRFVDVFAPPGATQTESTKERLYNFLGGIQIKDNRKDKRVKPFGHVLAGIARYTARQQQTIDIFPQFNFVANDRETSFAMKVGGGLDVRVSRRVDVRLIEVDYNPVFAGDRPWTSVSGPFTFSVTGRTAHNFTIGAGIVIH